MSSGYRYRSPVREDNRRHRGSSRSRTPPRRNYSRDRNYSLERDSGRSTGGSRGGSNYRDSRDYRGSSSQQGIAGNNSRNDRDRRDRREVDVNNSRRGSDTDDRRYYSPNGVFTKQESNHRSNERGRRFQSPEPGYERDVNDRRPPRSGMPGGRRGPRHLPVDHSSVPPFMLRVLVKHGDWHEEKDFNTKDGSFEKMCENDEIQVYAWIDSNLRTVVELTQDVRDEDRNPQHSFHMRIVKFDETMKPTFINLPTVHATYRAREDNISLGEKGFVVGDLVDICVTRGKYSQPGIPVDNNGMGGTSTSNTTNNGEDGNGPDVPMMKEERKRSESDVEGNAGDENHRRSDEAD